MNTLIEPTRIPDYIRDLLPWADGLQIKSIATFVITIIEKQTGNQAKLARTLGNQEAAGKWSSPTFVDTSLSAIMRLEADMTKRKRRQFTPELKADEVKLVRAGGRSIGQTAMDLDLGETALRSDLALDAPDPTPELAHTQVANYIDHFYNPERRSSTLDYFSLIEYELKHMVLQRGR